MNQRDIEPQKWIMNSAGNWVPNLNWRGNDKLVKTKGTLMSTPIFDAASEKATTVDQTTGQPTPKPTSKVLAGAVTGLALTVVVAVLTAITPDLLEPLGPWAGPAFAGIGALAVALGAYIKRPTGDVN